MFAPTPEKKTFTPESNSSERLLAVPLGLSFSVRDFIVHYATVLLIKPRHVPLFPPSLVRIAAHRCRASRGARASAIGRNPAAQAERGGSWRRSWPRAPATAMGVPQSSTGDHSPLPGMSAYRHKRHQEAAHG